MVRLAGDHLSVQENGETPQEVFPESERDFFSTVSDDVFSFDVDATGRATQMILHTGGREVSIKRIESGA